MASSLLQHAQNKLGPQLQTLASKQAAPKDGVLPLSVIIVKESQVRSEFEDEENPLKELADDIKKRGVLQPILVRPLQGGKYELIAGERRYRASTMAGLKEIPVLVKAMTDEEAEEAQFIENIHRKNLTLHEQAARIQRDLNANGGDVSAVLKKYNKPESGKAWVSKMLSLLNLPPQAQRLIDENVSADTEVILGVKRIEKVDTKKAQEVVDELKNSRSKGQGVARKTVNAAKTAIAAPKGNKQSSSGKVTEIAAPGNVVEPSNNGASIAELNRFYKKGQAASHWYEAVAQGIKDGHFNGSQEGNLRLLAFSKGYDKDESFSAKALLQK